MTTRREYLSGVAAAAAARCAADGYDLAAAGEWDPVENGLYSTGEFTPAKFSTSGENGAAGWLLEDEDFTEKTIEVTYTADSVNLTLEGDAEDDYGGALAGLTAEQAKDLGAALYQAGEELQQRGVAENQGQ
jgi:hypothetical protein